RSSNGSFPGLFKLLQLLLVAIDPLISLRDIGGVSNLDLGERNLFISIIARSNRVRSLEGHVFEHVRQARLAQRILHGARVHMREKRKDRSLGPFANNDREPVGELLDRSVLLEGSEVLP